MREYPEGQLRKHSNGNYYRWQNNEWTPQLPTEAVVQEYSTAKAARDKVTGQAKRGRDMAQREFKNDVRYFQELEKRGPEAVQKALEARNMPGWKAFGKHALEETKNILEQVKYDSYKPHYPTSNTGISAFGAPPVMGYTKEEIQKHQEQTLMDSAERIEGNKEFEENTDLSKLGKMVPSLVQGIGTRGYSAVARSPLTLASKAAGGLPHMQHFANRPALRHAGHALDKVATSALMGAHEGAMNITGNPFEGAAQGAAGAFLMAAPRTDIKLSKIKNKLGDSEKEIVKKWHDKGYRLDPGMRTGNKTLQDKHQQLRTDNKYRELVSDVDDANAKVVAKEAMKAMGIDAAEPEHLTKETLNKHLSNLRKQYEAIESDSMGKFQPEENRALKERIAKIMELGTDREKAEAQKLLDYTLGLKHRPGPSPDGKFQPYTFTGDQYQSMRRKLKQRQKTHSGAEGSAELEEVTKDLIKHLDEGLEFGIRTGRKSGSADTWKDLNEQYAMTKLVMEKGMRGDHSINSKALADHLMHADPERVLTEKGGRIKFLHDIAQLEALKGKQAGVGLGNTNIDEHLNTKSDKDMSLLSTPLAHTPSPYRATRHYLYQEHGWPSTTGLLGMPADWKNPLSAINLSRASEQTYDPLLDAAKDPAGTYDSAVEGASYLMEDIMRKLQESQEQ